VAFADKTDYDRAISDFSAGLRVAPDNADLYNNRCFARAIAGQLEQALMDCNDSLRLRPNDAYTLGSRGLTYLKLRQYDSAIADYDSALRINSKLAESYYGRGIARQKKGDTGGNADIAMAQSIKSNIAQDFLRYGVR
jgi:tetratricopeptide (TPR) repeat protein